MNEEQNIQLEEKTPDKAPIVERKGFNITSMILGVLAIVGLYWWFIAIPCGIIAIIFSVAGKGEAEEGLGKAGLITGIIGLIIQLLLIIFG